MDEILNNIQNWWYNLSGQKDEDEKKRQIKQARNFVSSYAQSPGFKERLQKALKYLKQYEQNPRYNHYPKNLSYTSQDYIYGIKLNPYVIKTKYDSDDGAYFNEQTNTVYIPDQNYDDDRVLEDYGNTAAHEYAHSLSAHITPYLEVSSNFYKTHPSFKKFDHSYKNTFNYPYIFPHFRNSKSYQQMLNIFTDPETLAGYERDPNLVYSETSTTHDASPDESYADLMALRYDLMINNIYDSRKANNIFTKEHLDKYKKLNRRNRIFDNFTDEQIIQMMNEVAQNNTLSQNLYAKKGIKLVPKKLKATSN